MSRVLWWHLASHYVLHLAFRKFHNLIIFSGFSMITRYSCAVLQWGQRDNFPQVLPCPHQNVTWHTVWRTQSISIQVQKKCSPIRAMLGSSKRSPDPLIGWGGAPHTPPDSAPTTLRFGSTDALPNIVRTRLELFSAGLDWVRQYSHALKINSVTLHLC